MLAQLKFVGTYLVPSLYPSVMLAISFVFAGLTSFARFAVLPQPGTEWPFVLNVLFWLGVVSLLLTIALTIKKLTARNPSINEVLSGLVSTKSMIEYKEEQRLRCLGLEKQISDSRHAFDERANTDLVESDKRFEKIFELMGERDQLIRELSRDMSRIHERTETHIRKFDQLDQKLDRAIERLPHPGHRHPQDGGS